MVTWNAGGIIGLYSALTGERLPGSLEAIAEGNALGRGPVVVEFTQNGMDLIRRKALGISLLLLPGKLC